MSHVVTVNIEIADLDALRDACTEMGAQLAMGQKTYNWYGTSVGDYPLPEGRTEKQLGTCDHAIKVPGVRYEVGVVKQANGKFSVEYDFYGSGGTHDGQMLKEKFGDGCTKLKQMYGVHAATRQARLKGYAVQRKPQPNGTIRLVCSKA